MYSKWVHLELVTTNYLNTILTFYVTKVRGIWYLLGRGSISSVLDVFPPSSVARYIFVILFLFFLVILTLHDVFFFEVPRACLKFLSPLPTNIKWSVPTGIRATVGHACSETHFNCTSWNGLNGTLNGGLPRPLKKLWVFPLFSVFKLWIGYFNMTICRNQFFVFSLFYLLLFIYVYGFGYSLPFRESKWKTP